MASDPRGVRSRQLRLLVGPSRRTIRWIPLAVIAPLAGWAVYAATHASEPPADGGLAAAGGLLATWAGSLLGDPSHALSAGVPTPLLFRRAIRLAIGLPPVAVVWGALLVWGAPGPFAATLTAMFAAQIALAIGIAAAALRSVEPGREVLLAAAGLFVVFIALPFVFEVDLTPIPSADTWWLHAGRWFVLAGAGLAAFLAASRDVAAAPTGPLVARIVRPAPAAGTAR